MKAVVKVDIVDGKCVVIYSDGSEQELYEYPSDEGGDGGAVLGTKHITSNGIYNASSDNLDGYSSVSVAVSAPAPVLKRKTITENGVYKASDDNAYGFEQVTVNVSSGSAVDFTDAISSYENRSFGSLFGSISGGKFGVVQKIVTSEMNPIEVQFPANITLKGILIYPLNVSIFDLHNESVILSVVMLSNIFDQETGNQGVSWLFSRSKSGSSSITNIVNKVTSWYVKDNKLTLVPQYPSTQQNNPFKFGSKYAFAYWY